MSILNINNSITPTGNWEFKGSNPYDTPSGDYGLIGRVTLDSNNPIVEIINIPAGSMISSIPSTDSAIQSSYSVLSTDFDNNSAVISVNPNIANLEPPFNGLFLRFDTTPFHSDFWYGWSSQPSVFFNNLNDILIIEYNSTKISDTDRTSITSFNSSNQYEGGAIDASDCTSLSVSTCNSNYLTELNVSNCTSLNTLYCAYNDLTELDVSDCTSLNTLYCRSNDLTELDITNCTSLNTLVCAYNDLTELDVSDCTSLNTLNCSYNDLTELDITNCTSLSSLNCYYNDLTQTAVDSILINLDNFGLFGGFLHLRGNATRSFAADAAFYSLTLSKNWNILD
jgi:hypothetical protein